MKNDGIHDNHRERLKRRYLENGLDSFSDHEVLELLLFFSIPRRNTNDTAHYLLNKFGSLIGVFDAEYHELLSQKGIGEQSAILLKLVPDITRRYIASSTSSTVKYDSIEKMAHYLQNHYIGATSEHTELLLFDGSMRMKEHITLSEGALSSTEVNIEKIAEIVFSRRASSFALAHNHVGMSSQPSQEDINITAIIRKSFSAFNKPLIEHFVISGTEWTPIMRKYLMFS